MESASANRCIAALWCVPPPWSIACQRNRSAWKVFVPTILRTGGFRLYFYSHEPNEPPHVHLDRGNASAKFWLENVALARDIGFSAKELGEAQRIVREHREQLLEAWHEFFGTRR
jgi:hypothetical protein